MQVKIPVVVDNSIGHYRREIFSRYTSVTWGYTGYTWIGKTQPNPLPYLICQSKLGLFTSYTPLIIRRKRNKQVLYLLICQCLNWLIAFFIFSLFGLLTQCLSLLFLWNPSEQWLLTTVYVKGKNVVWNAVGNKFRANWNFPFVKLEKG